MTNQINQKTNEDFQFYIVSMNGRYIFVVNCPPAEVTDLPASMGWFQDSHDSVLWYEDGDADNPVSIMAPLLSAKAENGRWLCTGKATPVSPGLIQAEAINEAELVERTSEPEQGQRYLQILHFFHLMKQHGLLVSGADLWSDKPLVTSCICDDETMAELMDNPEAKSVMQSIKSKMLAVAADE